MAAGVLYLSYDGILEPLGQSQVLAYLERLAVDRAIHLLSFEKAEDWADVDARDCVQTRIKSAGIHWHPRRYHKHPSALATAFDVMIGIVSGLWLVVRHRLRIIHARSYVPAVMALVLKRLTGARLVFDMRGFWADERVDGGLWPSHGRMYRVAKWSERRLLLAADHVVSLTDAAVRVMEQFDYLQGTMPPFSVIPTCVDLDRFVPMTGPRHGFVLGYVGSAGTWYQFDAVAECFTLLRELQPEARLLIVNRNEHALIRQCLTAHGVPDDAFELTSVAHAQVPAQMNRMHAGVFFIKPLFSKQASAPTRLGEFLGCGIPCLGNSGVGDMAGILGSEDVGVALADFGEAYMRQGLERLIDLTQEEGIQARCVAAAQRHFSLAEGVSRYRSIYRSLDPS